MEMQRVEILKINNPSEFWVAEKDSKVFLNLVNDKIDSEYDELENLPTSIMNENQFTEKMLIAVYRPEKNKWFRANVIEVVNTFGKAGYILCYMIDSAESITVPLANCKKIKNVKLQQLTPLAKRCTLFGIDPIKKMKTQNNDWSSEAKSFFSDICNSESKYYVKYSESVSKEKLNEVRLYLKTDHLIIQGEKSKKTINCINDLLVDEGFAKVTKGHKAPTNIEPTSKDDDYYNLNILKAHLTTKFAEKDIGRKNLLEELFKQNQNYQEATADPKKNIDILNSLYNVDNEKIDLFENSLEKSNILIDGIRVKPMRKISNAPLNEAIKDYLALKSIKSLSILDWYCWPTIIRGRHLFAMHNLNTISDNPQVNYTDTDFKLKDCEEKDQALSYICPLISLMLNNLDIDSKMAKEKKSETGYVKNTLMRSQNGPILLIICSSCKNAQRIYETINDILLIAAKSRHRDNNEEKSKKKLKALLLQGGGSESQYEVPLINGCDILICATPFCLLRMIGYNRTNLERLEYMVIDEAHLVLEKFPQQMKVLMSRYRDLLEVNENQAVAQFILFSSLWSTKLKTFMEAYLLDRVVIITNKLQSSHYGQTEHMIVECTTTSEKVAKCLNMVKTINEKKKNTIIFTSQSDHALYIYNYLVTKLNYSNVNVIAESTNISSIRDIQKVWTKSDTFQILICVESVSKFLEIDNAQCIIHFDFPNSKTSFGNRLWFMRKYFTMAKKTTADDKHSELNEDQKLQDLNNNLTNAKDDLESLNLVLENENQHPEKDEERLCSFLLFTKNDKHYSEGLINFLNRIGHDTKYLPKNLIKMAEKRRQKNELIKKDFQICPHVKAYGKCMDPLPSSCIYRHKFYPEIDKICSLDDDLTMPDEGLVKFKVCYVEDTNHVYINLLSHQDLRREKTTDYDKFSKFDMNLQMFYSNPANQQEITNKFDKSDLYAFKDITNNLFKRIAIINVLKRDNKIAYELLVKCIDYGIKLKISVHDLLKLPSEFKQLPPQALEVYFCDIRPIDRDLNWSTSSKISVGERLSKSKEFVGKIQLAAGNTLWLHPVSSFKYLKELNLNIIDDCVRYELVLNNFGIEYPNHLKCLKSCFALNGLKIARQEDEKYNLQQKCHEFMKNLYDEIDNSVSVTHAHLDRENDSNKVYLSSCDTPSKFWLQNEYSANLLERLNIDINKFIANVKEKAERLKESIREKTIDHKDRDKKTNDEEIAENFIIKTKTIQEKFDKDVFDLLASEKKPIYCLAKINKENEYNRARIVEYAKAKSNESMDEIKVFFVDYGDFDWVNKNEILPLPQNFIKVLPFQAIECSLTGLIQEENWTDPAGDQLWSQTHDDENFHIELLAKVDSFIQKNGAKKYSVILSKKDYPKNVNIAYRLVASGCARLTKDEEETLVSIDDLKSGDSAGVGMNVHQLRNLAKQLVVNFVNGTDTKKQEELIFVLESRSVIIKIMAEKTLISSGLIQSLSQSLVFIDNDSILILLMKSLRKNIFSTKKPAYISTFCSSNGLANLLFILKTFTENKVLTELILKTIDDLTDVESFKSFLVSHEEYVRALWILVEYITDIELVNNLLNILNKVGEYANVEFSTSLGNKIERIMNKKQIAENLELIETTAKNWLSKIKVVSQEKSESETDDIDEEEKEKMRRVHEYICAAVKNEESNTQAPKTPELQERYNKPPNPSSTQYLDEDSPPHSSDEEVQNQFIDSLIALFSQANVMNRPGGGNVEPPRNTTADMFANKPYKHPKIVWDQDREKIILKIKLKNVKAMTINYGTNSISFRTNVDGTDYGFDFDLFSEIVAEDCKAVSEAEMILVEIKKKVNAEWIRLLSSLVKLRFIKSEYNNLNVSTDDGGSETSGDSTQRRLKRKNKKKFKKFLERNDTERKHVGVINMDSVSSKTSDSSSDFDGNQFHDIGDSKDIFWD